ncbi:MAG: plasmid pRiA4b ORF-3 family protein [Tenericutes bacterium]|nr:plasmid pRiA4b ORF-3 family protein [Mycoplasmatota bacterium]
MIKQYELYLELKGAKPKVWRNILVNKSMTVAELAYIILTVFEMRASHLFKVIAPVGKRLLKAYRLASGDSFDAVAFKKEHPNLSEMTHSYELLDFVERDISTKNQNHLLFNVRKSKLEHAIASIGEQMELWYDFGDDWFIKIKLINIEEVEENTKLPIVTKGKGFGIIEDCGGIDGLKYIITTSKNKDSDEYQNFIDWYGLEDIHFSSFDIEEMNQRLEVIPSIYKRSYEKKIVPTEEELDLIVRRQ